MHRDWEYNGKISTAVSHVTDVKLNEALANKTSNMTVNRTESSCFTTANTPHIMDRTDVNGKISFRIVFRRTLSTDMRLSKTPAKFIAPKYNIHMDPVFPELSLDVLILSRFSRALDVKSAYIVCSKSTNAIRKMEFRG